MLNKSYPTNSPIEIINLVPFNDKISECEIKLLYPGKNPNRTSFSKAVIEKMANTIPRTPIVGYYLEEEGDFQDHGDEVIINSQGIHFRKKTVPYGFVSETAPIVWKEFLDGDGITREYLVVKGYLWNGLYPQLESVLKEGKGQSLEFFPESVVGEWVDTDEGEYFFQTDGIFSRFCILGDKFEPAFMGSSIKSPTGEYTKLLQDQMEAAITEFTRQVNEVKKLAKEKGGPTMEYQELLTKYELLVESNTQLQATYEALKTEKADVEASLETANTNLSKAAEDYTAKTAELSTIQETLAAVETEYAILKEEKETAIEAEKATVVEEYAKILDESTIADIAVSEYSLEDLTTKLESLAWKFAKENPSQYTLNSGVITLDLKSGTETIPEWMKAVEANS